MNLPEVVNMRNTAHGSGANGMAFYSYEAGDVLMDARRKDGRSPFVETWRYRWLPDGEFHTYADLRDAVNVLSDVQIAAERAKWPQRPKPPTPSQAPYGGKCWLHTDRPRTHSGWVQTCWHKFDGLTAMLCTECAEQAATDPGVIVRASEQRRADVVRHNAERKGSLL